MTDQPKIDVVASEQIQVDVLQVLKSLEWAYNHRRCAICTGWMVSPNGETDHAHTKTCGYVAAIAAVTELLAADREYDEAKLDHDEIGPVPLDVFEICARSERFQTAKKRRVAALATFGGES